MDKREREADKAATSGLYMVYHIYIHVGGGRVAAATNSETYQNSSYILAQSPSLPED